MSVETLLKKESYAFCDLCEIMAILRSENGCPWDREQNHQSIRNNLIEECYEVVEGIDRNDNAILKEELGDLLLQVVFHARIAEEEGKFDLDDVADGICKKLILRHPHIFGTTKVSGSAEVLRNWDEIKKAEKGQKTAADTVKAVSEALPALVRASKMQAKAAKTGFEYASAADTLEKVTEETEEVRAAFDAKDNDALSEEIGDLLFAVVNVARMSGINAEEALFRANDKFANRFESMEKLATEQGKDLKNIDITGKISLWEKAKQAK